MSEQAKKHMLRFNIFGSHSIKDQNGHTIHLHFLLEDYHTHRREEEQGEYIQRQMNNLKETSDEDIMYNIQRQDAMSGPQPIEVNPSEEVGANDLCMGDVPNLVQEEEVCTKNGTSEESGPLLTVTPSDGRMVKIYFPTNEGYGFGNYDDQSEKWYHGEHQHMEIKDAFTWSDIQDDEPEETPRTEPMGLSEYEDAQKPRTPEVAKAFIAGELDTHGFLASAQAHDEMWSNHEYSEQFAAVILTRYINSCKEDGCVDTNEQIGDLSPKHDKPQPFTKQEKEVMNLLVQAHNKFTALVETHPSETSEWLISFHRLQVIIGERVLRRDYPDTFTSI